MKEVWLEKYRPTTYSEFYGQEETVKLFKTLTQNKDLPNMILYGSPGTGKTSLIHILLNTLFTEKEKKECVLELNASDDRGIKVVRNVIKTFASYSVAEDKIKVIFLDEADSLTLDSQYALRRVMEDYSKTTRFILSCNYLNRIIQPLVSRCTLLNFHDFDEETTKAIIANIIEKENIPSVDLQKVITKYNCNLRKIINYLQSGAKENNLKKIDWEYILSLTPCEIHNEILTCVYDGYQGDYLIESFSNWVIQNHTSNASLVNFFEKVSDVISNVSNKGTVSLNVYFIVMYYKVQLN